MTAEALYNLCQLKKIKGTVTFSPDKIYRYLLTREWKAGGRALNFIMMNPSTADAHKLDPTVTKCLYWSILWGYDTLLVTNAFAYRSTDVSQIYKVEDPIGPDNDETICMAMQWAKNSGGSVIAAWGNHGTYKERHLTIERHAANMEVPLYCLDLNKGDVPKHPLYIKKSITPIAWKVISVPTPINVLQR